MTINDKTRNLTNEIIYYLSMISIKRIDNDNIEKTSNQLEVSYRVVPLGINK